MIFASRRTCASIRTQKWLANEIGRVSPALLLPDRHLTIVHFGGNAQCHTRQAGRADHVEQWSQVGNLNPVIR